MISNQIIQTSIDELKAITKVDIYVFDLDGIKVAATTEDIEISREIITGFAASPADSQVVGGYHFLKVLDDSEVAYVLASRSNNDDAYMVGKIAVSQIQNLIIAYKERFDRNNFFQNLILDNLLLVDIYNRAQKLHIEVEGPRIVYLVETRLEKDSSGMELLRSLFSSQNGDYITAVDEKNIILNSPGRVVRLLPDEKRIECAVDLLIMVNAEESVDHFLIFYAKRMKFYDAHLLINLFCIHCFVYI